MSESVLVVWDDAFTEYNFGPTHPLNPIRLDLTVALARELGVFDAAALKVIAPEPASDHLLEKLHDTGYIAAVRQAGETLEADLRHQLGTGDNPVFPRMHEASALVTGASTQAAHAVWRGQAQHAVNIAGGLHHAMRDHAWGFCVYNDPAIAIIELLEAGAKKVAYVDVDAHHGDGVQAAFYSDPRVLTISLHETGRMLFPGTGFPHEVGSGDGVGTSVNVALPPGTNDREWLRAFNAVVPPLVRAFEPDVLVTQHGCDSHVLDPLTHLAKTVDGQRAAVAALHALAHDVCDGRWVVTGGGGYELVRVVPRAWTHVLAEVAGAPVDPQAPLPDDWREYAARRTGQSAPPTMTDGSDVDPSAWPGGEGPFADPVDDAIAKTRRAVFPENGLDADNP